MDSAPQNIFLIGPMGSGKTAVGRRLAKKLGQSFVDSDSVIEERTGVDIAFIFEKEGEAGFRRREVELIDELTRQQGLVLATGGGAIIDADNRRHLADRGLVIYLSATVKQQLTRTKRGQGRPLLNRGNRRQILTDLFEVREPLYRQIADLVIPTDNRSVVAVTAEIVQKLAERDGTLKA